MVYATEAGKIKFENVSLVKEGGYAPLPIKI